MTDKTRRIRGGCTGVKRRDAIYIKYILRGLASSQGVSDRARRTVRLRLPVLMVKSAHGPVWCII